ncbi:MAG: signal peptidase II [Proteobacteria bacterium]|nr:signal peptidase II [Pseudomonadota bacterium]
MLAAALVVGLDQATKAWMIGLLLDPPRALVVTGFFDLVPVWNKGVSFGMLSGHDGWGAWLLGGVALAVAAGLAVWLARAERGLLAGGLGLVIGGALGNVIDRGRFGAVFDFLDFHVAGWHWPAFNLADSAITVGVGLLLLDGLLAGRGAQPARS